jgi:hypothetical protein
MMELASTWAPDQLADARDRFDARGCGRRSWMDAKREYADHVVGFAKTWDDVAS